MKNLKKVVLLALCLTMAAVVASCNKSNPDKNSQDSSSESVVESVIASESDEISSKEESSEGNTESDVVSSETESDVVLESDESAEESSEEASSEEESSEEEKAEYVVTYNANGGGVENATQTVVYGEEFTLAVPTKTGYIFKGWYVVDSEGEATSERLESGVWDYEGDVSVIAVWEEDPSSNGAYTDRY